MSALGMVETRGLIGLIVAADAMAKAAKVEILNTAKTGDGYTTVFVRGDVASCQSACEAGALEADKIGELVSVHVIPQPAGGLKSRWADVVSGKSPC
ncbi:MAG: BMC domain-containing protein [Elusimicrobia bacterium]|nr:BMC domain-containing protein [Elusimicrobiota bacterium]